MIFSTLADSGRYLALHPLFAHAFTFLRNTDLLVLAPGKHTVLGEEVFAIVEICQARTRAEAKLESHRRYIDIQLVLAGVDEMGWRPVAECVNPKTDYHAAHDIQFFNDAPSSWVSTPAGVFCIFFPEDAHAPLVGEGMIRKVVMKIAV